MRNWFQVLKPISPRAKLVLGSMSFVLPIIIWCVISYVPFVWHPQVLITDPGSADSLQPGMRMDKHAFADAVKEAEDDNKDPPRGVASNPIYLPAPHEVA
ncbi:MAG: ABC transporter permease, partial [Pseudolabrys sp.]